MKKLFLCVIVCINITSSFGQNVPQGMKYQAVARNTIGNIISNQSISIKINLVTQQESGTTIYYSESHTLTTNALGLFTLTIGEGKTEAGAFSSIPWSTSEVWMQVAIKDKSDYVIISNSKLLAVPYAFHSETSGALIGTTQGQSIKEEEGCECKDGLKSVQLLYLGSDNVTIKVFEDKNLKKELFTFSGKNNGDIILLTATARDKKLPNKIYFQVNNSSTITEMRSSCKDAILGETFGNFSVIEQTDVKTGAVCSVCDVKKDWKVGGNVVLAACNMLGSKNKTDLVVITDNTERLRVRTVGDIVVSNTTQSNTISDGALIINGGVGIAKNLNVGGKVSFGGSASFSGPLHVTDLTPSTSTSTGALIVDGGTGIGENLNVGGTTMVAGATTLGSTLNVTGATHLKNTLLTDGATTLGSKLDVTGAALLKSTLTTNGATHLKSSLVTDGVTTINNSFTVTKSDDNFVASFINNNAGNGDGIQIKLGKNHPAWNNSSYLIAPSPTDVFSGATNTIKGWVIDHTTPNPLQLLTFIPAAYVAGAACNIVNQLAASLNTGIGLPFNISGPINTALGLPNNIGATISGGLGLPYKIGEATIIPAINGPTLPAIPALSIPGIPQITCSGLPTLAVNNFSFTDVSNSLSNENEFISFVDKDNRRVGSIRAQSVSDWKTDYLDQTFFVNFMAGMIGIDPLEKLASLTAQSATMAKSYNKIGVEYSSGAADYAEWLERANPAEIINPGDIVGVKGGRVSKNLVGAEQILAVSHNPIVLGNAQTKEKEHLGNKIAFTGQVPVKVFGPVSVGDYIIGKGDINGYGIAVPPSSLTIDDLKLTVGRSWETNLNDGPKMVNTLIGIDNGDYIKIMKESQDKIVALGLQVKALEDKMNEILAGQQKNKKGRKK